MSGGSKSIDARPDVREPRHFIHCTSTAHVVEVAGIFNPNFRALEANLKKAGLPSNESGLLNYDCHSDEVKK